MKVAKKYIITCTKGVAYSNQYHSSPMTLEEAIDHYSSILSTGKLYEKGNKKINLAPKTMKALMSSLIYAANNISKSTSSSFYRVYHWYSYAEAVES